MLRDCREDRIDRRTVGSQSRNKLTSTASDEPSPSFLAAKVLKSVASDHK